MNPLDHSLSNHWQSPLGGAAKVGGGGGGTMMVAGEDGLGFLFLIYFRKLNNTRLKIIFELNWYTYGKLLGSKDLRLNVYNSILYVLANREQNMLFVFRPLKTQLN